MSKLKEEVKHNTEAIVEVKNEVKENKDLVLELRNEHTDIMDKLSVLDDLATVIHRLDKKLAQYLDFSDLIRKQREEQLARRNMDHNLPDPASIPPHKKPANPPDTQKKHPTNRFRVKTTPNHTSIEHPASPDYTKIPEPAYFNPTTNPQQNPPKHARITEPTKQKAPIQAQTETKITLRERVKHEDGRTALKDKRRDISPIETPFNDNIYEQKIEARHIRQRTRVNLTGNGNHEEKTMEEKLSEVFYLQLPGNTTHW